MTVSHVICEKINMLLLVSKLRLPLPGRITAPKWLGAGFCGGLLVSRWLTGWLCGVGWLLIYMLSTCLVGYVGLVGCLSTYCLVGIGCQRGRLCVWLYRRLFRWFCG